MYCIFYVLFSYLPILNDKTVSVLIKKYNFHNDKKTLELCHYDISLVKSKFYYHEEVVYIDIT